MSKITKTKMDEIFSINLSDGEKYHLVFKEEVYSNFTFVDKEDMERCKKSGGVYTGSITTLNYTEIYARSYQTNTTPIYSVVFFRENEKAELANATMNKENFDRMLFNIIANRNRDCENVNTYDTLNFEC